MGGIGYKAALAVHGLANVGQQSIDGDHERTHFRRQVLLINRVQFLFGALVDFGGQHADGTKQFAHQVAHHQ